ncbi:MAG: hypothetical protein WBZ51_12075 [Xanthobacteraceae bacterium]
MRFVNQHACRQCTRRMQEVANIEPIGSTPGLVAFLCVDCGLTDSILVYSVNRGGKVNHKQHAEHRNARGGDMDADFDDVVIKMEWEGMDVFVVANGMKIAARTQGHDAGL